MDIDPVGMVSRHLDHFLVLEQSVAGQSGCNYSSLEGPTIAVVGWSSLRPLWTRVVPSWSVHALFHTRDTTFQCVQLESDVAPVVDYIRCYLACYL